MNVILTFHQGYLIAPVATMNVQDSIYLALSSGMTHVLTSSIAGICVPREWFFPSQVNIVDVAQTLDVS